MPTCTKFRVHLTVQARYYISSLAASAEWQLAAARGHWSMEVTFQEDQSRVRKDHGPHNLLRRETSQKAGIQGKRPQAGWREDYLRHVLLG